MPNKTITIAWKNGSPDFSPPPGVTHLRAGDVVTLRLSGFPNGAGSIDAVDIYRNEVVNGEDSKGSRLCGWSRSAGNDCTVYGIVSDSATVVKITDQERPKEPQKYWFSASGSGPDGNWQVDPELINEPDP